MEAMQPYTLPNWGAMQTEETSGDEKNDVLAAFKSAKGLIRREIGRQIKLRHVPDLLFKFDTSLEYGRHISKLIDELGIEKTEEKDDEKHTGADRD